MQKSDSCDQWHCRRTSKAKRTAIAVNAIPEIYHKVAIVEQLLKEEKEIEKLNAEEN